ncbi:DUF1302 domain-containing protein [Solimonas marina]|uniref:DUF1302 domain-containing protein n=1 Tax=Solimonas marina TaxID=2714601 RepID=A0A970B824_9GAMM|nr:DUF1302 family protein [Solimonas marina]NKF24533.1 DUF1302 domain-containing protein [Solimonas marina]
MTAAYMACLPLAGLAASTNFDLFDDVVQIHSNTTFITGLSVRTEKQRTRSIGKNNLNPDVCGRTADGKVWYQDCQGLFRDQTFMAQHLADAPGQFSDNFDHGDLNYKQWDITQSGLRINQDLQMTYKGWTLFAKAIAYYDPVNDNFTEYHPNEITRSNYQQVGYLSTTGTEIIRAGQNLSILSPLISALPLGNNIVTQLLSNPLAVPGFGVRSDSTPCPANRNPSGEPCGIVYGRGGVVRSKRRDKETLREIGLGLQLLDLNLTGDIPLGAQRSLHVRVGRQQVIWGESTLEFFDSINVMNAPNLNNFFRLGGNGLDDFYQPINAVSLGTTLSDTLSASGWYALEFEPIELPAEGGFYSPVNLGTKNGGPDYLTVGFGNTTPDPDNVGRLLDSPLTLITNTGSRAVRVPDQEPNGEKGNYGVKLSYQANWLNNGTNLSFYFANYTSRTPMISFWSTYESCGKHARNTVAFLLACPDIPLLHSILGGANDPNGPKDSALGLDGLKFQFQYPKNIKMYGFSFNTSFGAVSMQGEVAYRPRDPLQVDIVDLAFAGLGPSLTSCDQPPGCAGSTVGLGTKPDGSVGIYGSSNFKPADGADKFRDTFDLIVGQLPGSGRSFPNFITPYRGGTIGQNPANSYIRGWEYFKTLSLDLGATYVEGNTDFTPRMIGADQVIWLFEAGARGILNLPPLDKLALAVPGTYTSPTAGADGSGADGSRQACSTNAACTYGPDGLRFNPHQAPLGLYPTKWSGGIGSVILIRWEDVLPDISIDPQIILKYDVFGHSPGYLSNYVKGRLLWDTNIEFRYRNNISMTLGYQMWAGGGDANLFQDRDSARLFLKYSF